MIDLESFIEKEINKKVSIFEYKNQKLKEGQELITFKNNLYIIEINSDSINLDPNGYFYLIYQVNLDFNILSNIFHNLYEDITILQYQKHLLIRSKLPLTINNDTSEIIESETYCNTYIFQLDKINNIQELDFKINLFNELFPIILKSNPSNKFITSKDLILQKNISTLCKDKLLYYFMNFDKIKNIDESLLHTGIKFIENDLNISKTSSSLFLHRNTLIYRLDKIKELLDLDLKNFKDAMIFYLSINSYFLSKN
ncbi:PucR family transcriptional regulator [Romboutsia sp. 1001713B170207_170306_H8]|uniref:PucR family transcriptional regulator n=1 Tax=Romboutsia sp. 1001713B170207_170306_H8 TaxID=2787112 RepID=UPI000821CF9B|nr:helix-turn-helix domain-containing protein [Romboutsia sp. 1001713B170207_170306_H8]SCG94779.1 Sugar diacid regulator [uncultured Clostridium sp.]